jgi:hypothetical protein
MADMADEDMPETQEMSEQIWAAFQHVAPLIDQSLKLEQNKAAPKRPRRGELVKPDQHQGLPDKLNLAKAMSQLAQLALKLDRDMQLMKQEDTYIFFFSNKGPDSCLALLMQTTEMWAQNHQEQKQATSKAPMIPLRLKLMQVLFTTLLTKLDSLGAAKEGSEVMKAALSTLLLLPDGTCPFLEWDQGTKKLRVSQRKPLTLKHLHQLCTDMLEALSDVNLVRRFHALPTGPNQAVTPWKLQLSMRSDQPWQILQMLSHSAIWLMMGGSKMGGSLKPHSQTQSPLAHQLQMTLGMTRGTSKGKGKGKSKTKTKPAAKEEK